MSSVPSKLGITREDFLARLRASLNHQAGSVPVPLAESVACDNDRLIRLTHLGENLPEIFAERAAATGMVAHRTTSESLAATLQSILSSIDVRCIVIDHNVPFLCAHARAAISMCVTEIIDPCIAKSLGPQFDAQAGLTGVVAAIAETGTLVVASDALRSRGAVLIPPVHIALVHETQIIPDMVDLWPLVATQLPTALTLITGPSKTADIEGILVTGVHGPRAVHIVLIASS